MPKVMCKTASQSLPSPAAPRGALARTWHRYKRSKSGVAAVEFALIATPFFFMMMGIIETMLIFYANLSIEDAMQQVGREIRTGQIQSSDPNMTPAQFKARVCGKLTGILAHCSDNILVGANAFDQFSQAACTQPTQSQLGQPNFALPFDTGTAGDIVIACAFYKWPITTPIIGEIMANMPGHIRLLQYTVVFRNEPFSVTS